MPDEEQARHFYRDVLITLNGSKIPYLVGGAHALAPYTGIVRDTKDLDVFVKPADCRPVLQIFSELGYETEFLFPHWIGKIYSGKQHLIDVIFSSGNGLCVVDQAWFEHGVEGEVIGVPVRLSPPEEMIWQKAFIMERLRYDGADVAHILQTCSVHLEWDRLLERFGPHWRVLFAHLILFGYIYPAERDKIPAWVMQRFTKQLQSETEGRPPRDRSCQGTYLSLLEYLDDIQRWGYEDARLAQGAMTRDEIRQWTQAFRQ